MVQSWVLLFTSQCHAILLASLINQYEHARRKIIHLHDCMYVIVVTEIARLREKVTTGNHSHPYILMLVTCISYQTTPCVRQSAG